MTLAMNESHKHIEVGPLSDLRTSVIWLGAGVFLSVSLFAESAVILLMRTKLHMAHFYLFAVYGHLRVVTHQNTPRFSGV